MICAECKNETTSLHNGDCFDCFSVKNKAWQERYARRMDASVLNPQKLVNSMLEYLWQHECKIVPDYMPPYPDKDTRPTCQVWFTYEDGSKTGLRYSRGPLQGYFWDVYGEDFHSPELALLAISRAPPPTRVKVVIPTHGK